MKIVVFATGLNTIGGGEKQLINIANALDADIILPQYDKGVLAKLDSNVNIISLDKKLPNNYLLRTIATHKLFNKIDFRANYDFYVALDIATPLKEHRPHLFYCQTPPRAYYDMKEYTLNQQRNPLKRIAMHSYLNLYAYFDRNQIRYIDHIACNSRNVANRIKQYYNREATVLYPPIHIEKYCYKPHEGYWLSVNRIHPWKRVELQIETFKLLPEFKLKIVGGLDQSKYIKYDSFKAKLPKNVELLGEVSEKELIDLYARCIGHITTAINEDFGVTPCLSEGTMIITKEGIKDIKDIKEGEKVLTHTGAFSLVEKTFKRAINEELVEITPMLSNIPITMTSNHPVLAIQTMRCIRQRNNTICKPNCQRKDYINKKTKWKASCGQNLYTDYKVKWIRVGELKKGDVLVYPIIRKTKDLEFVDLYKLCKKDVKIKNGNMILHRTSKRINGIPRCIEINECIMRLIGYYLGDGWYNEKLYSVSFAIHVKDDHIISDIKSILIDEFGLIPHERVRNNAVEIYVGNIFLAKLLSKYCGHGAKNKFIHENFICLPKYKLKALIIGLWRTDGYIDKRRFVAGYHSVSRQLINDIKTILMRVGIIPKIKVENNRGMGNGKIYSLIVMGKQFKKLLNILGGYENRFINYKKTYQRSWKDKDYFYIPINKIRTIPFVGDVYNLDVKEQHSFVGETMCFHNCEAAACGKPTVAVKEGGYVETVDYMIGWLSKANPNDLADAVRTISVNPEWFRPYCIQRAKQFDFKVFKEKINDLVSDIWVSHQQD